MTAAICVVILAHNEEARIAACLNSLPLADKGIAYHVVVNGSTDGTAQIAQGFAARHDNLELHVFAEGGKARSWNRILFDELPGFHAVHVFVDGDAEVAPGSIRALAATLAADPHALAAAGLPVNGRKVAAYRDQMRREHGLFGDLYALRGDFLAWFVRSPRPILPMKAAGMIGAWSFATVRASSAHRSVSGLRSAGGCNIGG
jgi:glycosyltransferase involved in cell wall biosynthesis